MLGKLSALKVKNLSLPGYHNDGGGLYLRVTKRGTKSWVYRWRDRTTKRLRDMGLGSCETTSLREAREAAQAARKLVRKGIDPIVEKRRQQAIRAAEAEGQISFDQAVASYIATHSPAWKNPKHVAQWQNTLRTYASPYFGRVALSDISDEHVFRALDAIWRSKTETASRVRARIERVLDWAIARGYRSGPNPARWKGHLSTMLPPAGQLQKVRHHPSLPYQKLPAFIHELQRYPGVAARALEFTILNAARTGEVIGSEWSEISLDDAVWAIPASRMKSGKTHRVPLSSAAMRILDIQRGQGPRFIFPGIRKDKHLSNAAMLKLLKDMGYKHVTTHGFRSTFRNWAAEQTNFPREVCESSLAHGLTDKVEAAYFTSDLLLKRRKLLQQWATFCCSHDQGENVTPISSTK